MCMYVGFRVVCMADCRCVYAWIIVEREGVN